LDEDCDAAQFYKYATQIFVTLETAASFNNEQLENEVNEMNLELTSCIMEQSNKTFQISR
jgi:hypothetical protein